MINDIIEEFNFCKVQLAMEYLCWKWRGEDVTIDMLKETAIESLRDAAESRLNYFKASVCKLLGGQFSSIKYIPMLVL